MRRIKDLYWKIFFSFYWVAKDLNKRNDPPWSACGAMEIVMISIFSGVLFFACFVYGDKIPYYKTIITLGICMIFIVNEILKPRHVRLIKKYEYLSQSESKSQRFKIVFLSAIIAVLVMIIGGLSMNKHVQFFLENMCW